MRYKIILGIIIPLILIILLAIIGSLDIGFTVTQSYKQQLEAVDFFNEITGIKQEILIGSITLKNEYFLPKRYELSPMVACLIDDEAISQPMQAGTIFYSQGEYVPTDFNLLKPYYSRFNSQVRSVETPSNEEEIVSVYLQPNYYLNYKNASQLLEEYGNYDAVVLVEYKASRNIDYYSQNCQSLSSVDIASGTRISLSFQ